MQLCSSWQIWPILSNYWKLGLVWDATAQWLMADLILCIPGNISFGSTCINAVKFINWPKYLFSVSTDAICQMRHTNHWVHMIVHSNHEEHHAYQFHSFFQRPVQFLICRFSKLHSVTDSLNSLFQYHILWSSNLKWAFPNILKPKCRHGMACFTACYWKFVSSDNPKLNQTAEFLGFHVTSLKATYFFFVCLFYMWRMWMKLFLR